MGDEDRHLKLVWESLFFPVLDGETEKGVSQPLPLPQP